MTTAAMLWQTRFKAVPHRTEILRDCMRKGILENAICCELNAVEWLTVLPEIQSHLSLRGCVTGKKKPQRSWAG